MSFDIGPMAKFEIEDTSKMNGMIDEEDLKHSENGKVIDLVLPVLVLIAVTIFFMLKTGEYFDGKGISLKDAFGNSSVNISLTLGSAIALFVAFVMYIPRKLLKFREFMDCITEGVK